MIKLVRNIDTKNTAWVINSNSFLVEEIDHAIITESSPHTLIEMKRASAKTEVVFGKTLTETATEANLEVTSQWLQCPWACYFLFILLILFDWGRQEQPSVALLIWVLVSIIFSINWTALIYFIDSLIVAFLFIFMKMSIKLVISKI